MPRLRKQDFADESFFKALTEALDSFKKLGVEARAFSKAIQQSKGFNEYTKNAGKASTATNQFAASEKKLIKTINASRFAQTEGGKQQAIATERKRRATAENKKYAQSQLTAVKSTNTWRNALKSFQFRFNALGNLIAQAAATVFRAFVRVVRQSVDIIIKLDKATARLAAVTGKTRKEIEKLTKQAKKLGATTQFTTTEITGLQVELAKLGFTVNEIIAATPGILSFATATGADLAEAAKTAGVAVRVFGLNASETTDAVATMAVATTKSGLAFEDLDTILSTLGPVAKAYGFTLEDVIALTGELKTAGFEANKAATATRNILLNLADANGSLAKSLGGSVKTFDDLINGLVTLDEKGINLADSLELTDKRSVAAFSRFLEGAEAARELRDGITGVNDELQAMVDVQLDTIAGDIDLLKSAWEGFVTGLGEGGILRKIVQFLTDAVLQVQNLDIAVRKFHKQTAEQIERSFTVLQSLSNKQGKEFMRVINAYSEATVDELQAAREAIIFHLSEVRNINKKEAEALYNELLKQRKEALDAEFQALLDHDTRMKEKAAKDLKKAGVEKEIETLNTLEAKVKKLKEQRGDASASELAAINIEIAAIERKISKLNELGEEEIALFKLLDELAEERKNSLVEDEQEAVDVRGNAWDLIEEATAGAIENLKKMQDQELADDQERAEKKLEIEEWLAEQEKIVEDKKQQYKKDIANEAFNFLLNLNDRRIEEIDSMLAKEIGNEKQLQAEKLKLQRRAAILEKAQALFSIALATAQGVMNYAKSIETAPLIPWVIGLGIAEAAAVIAKPIPKYATGTRSSKEGPAHVGERGSELMVKNGHVGLSPSTDTVMDLARGTKIYPADVTKEILSYTTIANGLEARGSDGIIMAVMNEIKSSNDKLRRELRNKPVQSVAMTPAGILTAVTKGNTTIKSVDKYFK